MTSLVVIRITGPDICFGGPHICFGGPHICFGGPHICFGGPNIKVRICATTRESSTRLQRNLIFFRKLKGVALLRLVFTMSALRWFKKSAFDAPHLNSPQPCTHGAGCNYQITKDDLEIDGCCAFVHPGEEGTGRRLFEERTTTNEDGETVVKKACVRLTGRAGFYERRRLRLSWKAWCEREGIPYTPNIPNEAQKTLTLPSDRDQAVAVLMKTLSEFGVDIRRAQHGYEVSEAAPPHTSTAEEIATAVANSVLTE